MPLNIKNPKVEHLAAEAANRQGISKTEAVRRALEAHLQQLDQPTGTDREERLIEFLQRDVWPYVPSEVLGHPVTKREREHLLGYAGAGV